MTPPARIAAAIEVLDTVINGRSAADDAIRSWGRNHRFAGSKDRKAIADHVYNALRARARSSWSLGSSDGRSLMLGALRDGEEPIAELFTGEGHGPAALSAEEQAKLYEQSPLAPEWVEAGVPEWLTAPLRRAFGQDWVLEAKAASVDRAPVDLRVNALRGPLIKAISLMNHEEVRPEPTATSAWGLRLPAGFARDVQTLRAFTSGWIEVQDEASQIAAWLAGAVPGSCVVDYCAGGGGKSLAFAACLRGQGRLVASDVDSSRLRAMTERLKRAGARAEVRRIGQAGEGMDDLVRRVDVVFVDAPCSGSGTWRRHPEAAWRLTPAGLDRLGALQRSILERASELVRIGGRLVYATCSLFEEENGDVASAFLAVHPDFKPVLIERAAETENLTPDGARRLAALARGGHTLQLSPRRSGTDGFFAALFERTA